MRYIGQIIILLFIAFVFSSCGLVKKVVRKNSFTHITEEKPTILKEIQKDSIFIILPPKTIKDTINLKEKIRDSIITKQNDGVILEIKIDSIRNEIYIDCRQANERITFRERTVEKDKPVYITKEKIVTNTEKEECDCPNLFWYTLKVIGITIPITIILYIILKNVIRLYFRL